MLKHKNSLPLILELQNVLRHGYPDFVWAIRPKSISGHVPVFSSHEASAEDFEAKLQFLKANGYNSVTADAVVAFVSEEKRLPSKSVMLSFDDGRKSVWTIAFPLLKKYGFSATVFLAPGIVRSDETLSPTLEDVWNGVINKAEFDAQDFGPQRTLSWDEISVMHKSGVIDFQSHGLNHQKIAVENKIVTFVSPQLIKRYFFEFDIPYMENRDWWMDTGDILGAPVYQMAPFFSEANRLINNDGLKEVCVDYVKQNGGRDFFELRDWEKQLRHLVREFRMEGQPCDSFETLDEQKARIALNLQQARDMIEERLGDKAIRHFAYPWGTGSEMAIECSKKTDHLSNFWATVPGKPYNTPGSDPYRIVRYKHDYIWRLPGDGRRSLLHIFMLKFKRRIQGQLDY